MTMIACRLISDLVVVIVSATIGGITFSCLGQPVSSYNMLFPVKAVILQLKMRLHLFTYAKRCSTVTFVLLLLLMDIIFCAAYIYRSLLVIFLRGLSLDLEG